VVVQKRLHHPSHLHIVIIAEKKQNKALPPTSNIETKNNKKNKAPGGAEGKGLPRLQKFPHAF
jgi:hypothetical protein